MVCYFNDTATTEIYTLSLHDALPIYATYESVTIPLKRSKSDQDHEEHQSPPRPSDAMPRQGRNGAPRRSGQDGRPGRDRKSTRLNSSHANISYAVFCLKKKKP